jgi:hypothetical protein
MNSKLSNRQLIAQAVDFWANHIETGDMTLSAVEAQHRKKPFNALEKSQMQLVLRLRKISERQRKKDLDAVLPTLFKKPKKGK